MEDVHLWLVVGLIAEDVWWPRSKNIIIAFAEFLQRVRWLEFRRLIILIREIRHAAPWHLILVEVHVVHLIDELVSCRWHTHASGATKVWLWHHTWWLLESLRRGWHSHLRRTHGWTLRARAHRRASQLLDLSFELFRRVKILIIDCDPLLVLKAVKFLPNRLEALDAIFQRFGKIEVFISYGHILFLLQLFDLERGLWVEPALIIYKL